MDFNGVFCWILPHFLFVMARRLKPARIDHLCFSFDDMQSFWGLCWGVFWSVLWICLQFLAIGFSNIDWSALSMQTNFTFFVCASFIKIFLQKVTSFFFDFFWKPIDPFFTFPFNVNCLLMFYSVYRNSNFSNFYWRAKNHVFVGKPGVAGYVFLAGQVSTKLELFEKHFSDMHTNLGPGAQMLFRHNQKKSDTLLFFFIVLVDIVASLMAKKIFHLLVMF